MDVRQSSSSSLCSSKKQNMENDNNKSLTTIECLPDELILQICSNVASNSTIDTMNLKRVSKRFLQICSHDQVLRCSAYFEHLPGWNWNVKSPEESESNYLKYRKSLRNAGNPYALFYAGLDCLDYNENISQGLGQLIQAAEGGYMLALYISGIVLYCRGGEEKQKGIDFLKKITKPSCSMAIILKEVEETYRRTMNCIISQRYLSFDTFYYDLKEQYESDTVKCKCNGIERKWFKENCRGENCWGNGKDMNSSFICQACLSEEIVYQFLYGD